MVIWKENGRGLRPSYNGWTKLTDVSGKGWDAVQLLLTAEDLLTVAGLPLIRDMSEGEWVFKVNAWFDDLNAWRDRA